MLIAKTVQIKYGYVMDKYLNKLKFDFLTNQKIVNLVAKIDSYNRKLRVNDFKTPNAS